MPLAVDNLTPDSFAEQIREAISKTIEKLMQEGKSQKDAAGQAYGIARGKTHKDLDYGK